MWRKLAKLRDEDGIKANTRAVIYDNNTGRTLWMYELLTRLYSKFNKIPQSTSMFLEIPNLLDPAEWFSANNSAGIDQSFGIGAETPEWFENLKRISDARTAPFGH